MDTLNNKKWIRIKKASTLNQLHAIHESTSLPMNVLLNNLIEIALPIYLDSLSENSTFSDEKVDKKSAAFSLASLEKKLDTLGEVLLSSGNLQKIELAMLTGVYNRMDLLVNADPNIRKLSEQELVKMDKTLPDYLKETLRTDLQNFKNRKG